MIQTKTKQTFLLLAATGMLAIPVTSSAAGWVCPDPLTNPVGFDYGKNNVGCETITSSDVNLSWLRAGNMNYVGNTFTNLQANSKTATRTSTTTNGQKPKAIVLTCSDSRVPPEILFNKGLGEIFVVRVAGNIIAKHEIGSIEYGVEHLGANLIIVLGHERCGAVQTTYSLAPTYASQGTNLDSLINSIKPAVSAVIGADGSGKAASNDTVGQADQLEECIVENVKMVAESLESQSTIVKEAIEGGYVKMVTAKYDLDDGIVRFFPTTESASYSTSTATLNGIINDNRLTTTASFEYGTSTAYGLTKSAGSVTAGTDATPISANIIGLNCNTTYHYRAVGTDSDNKTTYGNDKTFTTAACPPYSTPVDYSSISGTTFTVQRVDAGGTPVTVYSGSQKAYTDTDNLIPNTVYTYNVSSDIVGQSYTKTIRTPLYRGWNIIGVPYNTTGIPVANLFTSATTSVYEWVPTGSTNPDNNGGYTIVSQLTPGKGYFVMATNTNTTVINTTGSANAANTTVTLKPGYTLISSPRTTNLSSIDSTWQVGGIGTLAAAVAGGKIDNTLYWWNGTTYDPYLINSSTVIEPWKAYWILNKDVSATYTLTIP